MKLKTTFIISIVFICLLIITVVFANDNQEQATQLLDINQIKNTQPFGTLKQVELNELEKQEGRTAYIDDKYRYLVNLNGSINAVFKLDDTFTSKENISLDKKSASRLSQDIIKKIMPSFDTKQYKIQFNEYNGFVNSIYYYLVDENSTQYGAIMVSFNEQGEVSSICSDLMPDIMNTTKNNQKALSENQAINKAYNTINNWIKNQNTKKSNIINPNEDPKVKDSEIISNDFGEKTLSEPEFVGNAVYDLNNKSSHNIESTSYYNMEKNRVCWLIKVDGIKRTINKRESKCSFLVIIDAETGEVYNLNPSR